MLLHDGELLVLFLKARKFALFPVEGADHADTGQVLACHPQEAVQFRLHLFIERGGHMHEAEHDRGQKRDRDNEDQGCPHIDGEGHDHRAEHDEGRAEQQAEREVQACLDLVHIAGDAGEQCGGADCLSGLIGK